jgi:iron complex transport system substrate-binding protein
MEPGGPRIVSLLASATEIVCALGFERNLVGRSHECDFPESVRGLPVCSAPRLDVEAGGRRIDEQVKARLAEALSIYRVDGALLRALRPDLIVTQTLCEVCAVSPKDVEQAVAKTLGHGARLVSTDAADLAGVFDDIARVAGALQVPERAAVLGEQLRERMQVVATRAATLPDRPRAACIEWIDPLMAAGNWVPELIGMAGGRNLFGEAGRHSPWLTWEALRDADPDVIVVMPCGFDLDRARREIGPLIGLPGWGDLRAVRGGRVALADGQQYFNRPGPRLAESLQILAEILHPGAFDFGHRGIGWQPLGRDGRVTR